MFMFDADTTASVPRSTNDPDVANGEDGTQDARQADAFDMGPERSRTNNDDATMALGYHARLPIGEKSVRFSRSAGA